MKENKKDNKPWYEKLNILIGIIVGIFSILGIRVFKDGFIIENEFNVQSLFDQEDTSQKDCISENNPQLKESEDKIEDDSLQDKKEEEMGYASSGNFNNNPEKQILIDVNAEILSIREKYYNLPKPASIPEPTLSAPISVYQDANSMTVIKVYHGYNDMNYSRFYYFDEDGKLYFAFVFDKLNENRLYFKNDTLIRYIDESGVTYDLYDNLDTCEWEEFTLKESYELFNDSNQ